MKFLDLNKVYDPISYGILKTPSKLLERTQFCGFMLSKEFLLNLFASFFFNVLHILINILFEVLFVIM